ncbi:MAG: hypothetical protein FWE16_03250 [Firmicutes bacterium]|nr:hypothetical protein [Bacillota bacterium]
MKNWIRRSSIVVGVLFAAVMFGAGALLIGGGFNRGINDQAQVAAATFTGPDGSGTGTVADPFRVGSQATLNGLVRTYANVAGRHFVLVNDIDMVGNWTVIPTLGTNNTFDGQNFTIRNMTINGASNVGLFGIINGATVRNIRFENVHISASGARVGTVAGVVRGSTRIENIMVMDGIIRQTVIGSTTAHTFGGIVGEAESGTHFMEDVFNGADITGSYFVGGILGHAWHSGAVNTTIRRAMNNGTITANHGSWGYSGGIIGLSQGSSVSTIEFAVNNGAVISARDQIGGIHGVAWSGNHTIRHVINNAPITATTGASMGGVATRNTSTVTIQNAWFNSTKFGGLLINNQLSTTITTSGSRTTTQMQEQAFLNEVNTNASQNIFVFDSNGQIFINTLLINPIFTYTFEVGLGVGEEFYFTELQENPTVTLPYQGMYGFPGLPTRVGYIFDGWYNVDSSVTYAAQATFNNTAGINQVFVATFRPAEYNVVFSDNFATPQFIYNDGGNISTITSIRIGDDDRYLTTASAWPIGFYWLARVSGSTEYVIIGNTQTLSLSNLFDQQFILDHAFSVTQVGDTVGQIFIRVQNAATATMVNIDGAAGMEGAGTFEISIDGEPLRNVIIGSRVSLPTSGDITTMVATPNEHFRFVNFTVYNGVGTPVGTFAPINGIHIPVGFDLTIMQNWTIVVNFAPYEYIFEVFGALRGEEDTVLAGAVTVASQTTVEIGEVATVNAVALPYVGIYRLVAWKIQVNGPNNTTYFVYQPVGVAQLNLTFNIDAAFLARHLSQDGRIVIIAEYLPTFNVNVGVAAGQEANGNINVTVVDGITGETNIFFNQLNLNVVYGSTVIVEALPNQFFDLLRFDGTTTEENIITWEGFVAELRITEDRSVRVEFGPGVFEIDFRARESQVNRVGNVGGFTTTVNDSANQYNRLRVGDTLNNIGTTTASYRDDYRFVNFTIRDATNALVPFEPNMLLDLEVISRNLDDLGERFVIYANYVRVFNLNVAIGGLSQGMGHFRVYANGILTSERVFDAGTNIVIYADANDFHEILSFGGSGDGEVVIATPYRLEIQNIVISRTITINFLREQFDLTGNLTYGSGGYLSINEREDLTINSQVVLTATVPGGRQIRNWTINGYDINSLPRDTVFISGDSVTVILNAAWLERHQFRLDSNVTFRMTTGVLLAIILPSVIIPILLLLAVLYFLHSRKKYATIKAALVDANRQKVTFNTGSFIADLKEGKNVGQVTKDDVKKAMKDDKDKK